MTKTVIDGLHVVREGAGPPLLFVTGLGGTASFWIPQFERFAPTRTCIGFDHRKIGKSATSDAPTTVASLAEDVVAILDALDIDRCDIIGHSLGGTIAQHLGVFYPERCGKLVMSSSWCGPTPWFTAMFEHRKTVLRKGGVREYLLHGGFIGNPGWWSFENFDRMVAGVEARLDGFAGVDIECERMDALIAYDLRERIGEIVASVLVTCARDDGITPLPLSEEVAHCINGARLDVMERGDHFAPVTMPDAWAAPIAAFLK